MYYTRRLKKEYKEEILYKDVRGCVKMVKRFKEVFIEVMFELGYFQLQLPGSPLYHIYFIIKPLGHCVPFEFWRVKGKSRGSGRKKMG